MALSSGKLLERWYMEGISFIYNLSIFFFISCLVHEIKYLIFKKVIDHHDDPNNPNSNVLHWRV